MRMYRLYYLFLVISACFIACDNDDDFAPHKCSGTEYSMSLDGQPYEGILFGGVSTKGSTAGVDFKRYEIITEDTLGNELSLIVIDIAGSVNDVCPTLMTYNVVPAAINCVTGDTSTVVCSNVSAAYKLKNGKITPVAKNSGRGTLTITDCNATDTIMAGNFNLFALDSLGNDTMSFTNGSFSNLCFHFRP